MTYALVFQGFQSKLLQMRWLKTNVLLSRFHRPSKKSTGLIPSRASGGEFVPCPSPSFWWLPITLGISCLIQLHHSSLLSSCHLLFVIVPLLLLQGHLLLDLGLNLKQDDLILRFLITSVKTLHPNSHINRFLADIISFFFLSFFFSLFFRATPAPYGSSQARG